MATLRDYGMAPRTAVGSQDLADQTDAANMGEARKGFTSGLYGGDANALAAQVSSLRAAGRNKEADDLMPQIAALNERAATFAPTEPSLYGIGLDNALRSPGRVANWALGAMGQGTASMMEPIGAEVGIGGAGALLSKVPYAPIRALGTALQYGAPLVSGALNYRQNKGEFVRDAWNDPAIMAKTPQEIENAAMVHGAVAGSLDTALPHAIGGRLLGKPGLKALEGLSRPSKMGLDLLGEGVTETMQEGVKKQALGYLNPLRDKSGDLGDYVDSLAGGIAGAGPASGLSHLAGSGHARVATPDDPNNDVSGKGGKPATPTGMVGEVLKRTNASKVNEKELTDWHSLMDGADANGDYTPESLTAQHTAVTKELAARAARGDAVAQKHLATLASSDPSLGVPDDALEHIVGDGSAAQREKLVEAFKNRKLSQTGKQSPEAELASRIAEDHVPEKVKYESDNPGHFTNVRALARNVGSQIVDAVNTYKDEKSQHAMSHVVDRIATQAVQLWDGPKAQQVVAKIATSLGIEKSPLMQQLQQAVGGTSRSMRLNAEHTTSRENAAATVVGMLPTEIKLKFHDAGIDLTDAAHATKVLTMAQEQLAKSTPNSRKAFVEGVGGKDVADKILNFLRTSKIEKREDVPVTPDDSRKKDKPDDTSPGSSDDLSQENEDDKWDIDGAHRNIEKAPGAKLYMFRGEKAVRDSVDKKHGHPFFKNKDGNLPTLLSATQLDKSTKQNSLEAMQARVYAQLAQLGGDSKGVDTKTKRPIAERNQYGMMRNRTVKESLLPNEIKGPVQPKGEKPILGIGSYRIRAASAKEVMDDRNVSAHRRVQLLRQYLAKDKVVGEGDDTLRQISTLDRKIAERMANTPKMLAAGIDAHGRTVPFSADRQTVAMHMLLNKNDTSIKWVENPKYAELESLIDHRQDVVSKLAERMGVDVSGADDLGKLADAYFSTRFLVTAEQMAEKDQLRLNNAEVVQMIRRGSSLINKSTDPAIGDDPKATQASMNLIRFESPLATAEDGIAVVPVADLVAWVDENQKGRSEGDGDRAHVYRDKLMEGIGALLADGFMDPKHPPYMLNAKGEKESFAAGFPPSLKLGRKTQAELNAEAKKQKEAKVRQNKKDAAQLATRSPDEVEEAEQRIKERQQKKVALDQQRRDEVKNTDSDELLDQGKERDPKQKARPTPAQGSLDLSDPDTKLPPTWPSLPTKKHDAPTARYWDEPHAPATDASVPSNPEAGDRSMPGRAQVQGELGGVSTANDVRDAKNGAPSPTSIREGGPGITRPGQRVDEKRSGRYPVAPETASTRSDAVRTQLDAEPEQTEGVPIDRTDIRNFTSTFNAALDKIQTLTAANAMGRAKDIANRVLWMFHSFDGKFEGQHVKSDIVADPRGAFKNIQQMVDGLTRPTELNESKVAGLPGKEQVVGGKFYAAPLANILTPKNAEGIVALAKDKQRAQAIVDGWRSSVASALLTATDDEIAKHNKIALAKLLTGDNKLTTWSMEKELGALVKTPAVVAKAEPAPASSDFAKMRVPDLMAVDAAKLTGRELKAWTDAVGEAANKNALWDHYNESKYLSALQRLKKAAPTEGRKLSEAGTVERLAANEVQNGPVPQQESIRKALAYVRKVLGPNIKVEFLKDFDADGEWVDAEQLIKLALNRGSGLETTAHHEALHGFFSRLLKHNPDAAKRLAGVMSNKNDDAVKQLNKQIVDARSLLERIEQSMKNRAETGPDAEAAVGAKHAKMNELAAEIVAATRKIKRLEEQDSDSIYNRLKGLLRDSPDALAAMERDPEERVAYAYQFWVAGHLEVDKPATTIFAKFRKMLRKVLGMVRESETALDIMTAFHQGQLADEDAGAKAIKKIMDREKWNEDVKMKFDKVISTLHYELSPAHEVLSKEDLSAIVRGIGDRMFTNPGDAGAMKNPGYINLRTTWANKFTNWQDLAVGTRTKLTDKDRVDVITALQNGDPKTLYTDDQRKAYDNVQDLLKRFHRYATDSGTKLEFISNYFPRIWNTQHLLSAEGKEAFAKMLNGEKYAKTIDKMLKTINEKAKQGEEKTKDDFIAAVMRSLVDRGGVDDESMDAESMGDMIFKPFFASNKERSFKWIEAEDVQPFLEKDLVGALSRYFQQGVRSVEFTRQFGESGQNLRKNLIMRGEKEFDPRSGQMVVRTTYGPAEQEMYDGLKAKGTTGKDAEAIVNRRMKNARNAVAAMEGSLGGDISDGARKLSSNLIAYQNLRLLPMSLFAAFGDVAGIGARADEKGLAKAYEAFMNGLKDVFANWKRNASDMPGPRKVTMLEHMAEAMGVVSSHMYLEQVGKAHTSEFMTDAARNIGRKLFMVNGLTAWDRSMRVTATKFAVQFIERHKSLPDKANSARWLAELGLQPGDITLDKDGKLVWDKMELAQSRMTPNMSEKARGEIVTQAEHDVERVHSAVVRWVEGAVLSPNAALRPSRASDPHWSVFYHLKQFTYAMHHVILKRAYNEARQGNMNPIGALAGVIPLMIVSDAFKGLLTNGGTLPDYMKAWNVGDWIGHGVTRGGLTGLGQFGLDAMRDPFSVAGPTVEQFMNMVLHPSDLGKNIVGAIPGANLLGQELSRAMD